MLLFPCYTDTICDAVIKELHESVNDQADKNTFRGYMQNMSIKAELIYICSPNNPTGAVFDHKKLKAWVDYANSIDGLWWIPKLH